MNNKASKSPPTSPCSEMSGEDPNPSTPGSRRDESETGYTF